jgi:hypothetical protein
MKKVIQKLLLIPIFLFSFSSLQAQDYIYEIQLATYASPDYKKFKSLRSIGYVYAVEMENSLSKILMGTYTKNSTADRKLNLIKKKGFKDAYIIKKLITEEDAVYIVQLATYDQESDIYWPDWQRLVSQLTVQLSDSKVRVAAGPYYTREEAEQAQQRIQVRGPKDVFIKKVSSQGLHKITNFDLQRSPSYGKSSGGIRSSIKAIQGILVAENLYYAKPNGVLSPSTKAAIIKYKKTNSRYIRYRKMAEDLVPENEIEEYTLQYYINMIPNDPTTAAAGLQQFKNPISKIYLAYIYLNGDVVVGNKTTTVNNLMNTALSEVFKRFKGKTRYDFSMKYSYEEVGQLISHLKAMYEVVKARPDMPCWLFDRHPMITKKVFQPYWHSNRDDYTVSIDCGSFMDAEEMRILLLISKEFASAEKAIEGISSINRLFVVPQLISHQEMETLEKWNGNLWKGLKAWAKGSPLQQNMYTLLRFAYYDALQNLEIHFMYKGLPGIEARSLGLKMLKESVGCNLDEYCGE